MTEELLARYSCYDCEVKVVPYEDELYGTKLEHMSKAGNRYIVVEFMLISGNHDEIGKKVNEIVSVEIKKATEGYFYQHGKDILSALVEASGGRATLEDVLDDPTRLDGVKCRVEFGISKSKDPQYPDKNKVMQVVPLGKKILSKYGSYETKTAKAAASATSAPELVDDDIPF